MTAFNGRDKQTVYVTTYVLQYMAMIYYYYRYNTWLWYIIIGTIHGYGMLLLSVHIHIRYYIH